MKPAANQRVFVGVMTGTSIDGLDLAAIQINPGTVEPGGIRFVAAAEYQLPPELTARIKQIARASELDWQTFGQVDALLGEFIGARVNQFLEDSGIARADVRAIGSHGQTVHHSPDSNPAFTVQLGDASRICEATGLCVVSDFRRADMAVGGQGAPLVPAFHAALFGRDKTDRAICNIGGIANVTLLPKDETHLITGFDTGPGNTLLDAWVQEHRSEPYDTDGAWAASGSSSAALLSILLADPYVQRAPPKSTGVEHYNLRWLESCLNVAQTQNPGIELQAADVQATLLEFTARSIVNSVRASQPDCGGLIVCGGGRRNKQLMLELDRLSSCPVVNCDTVSASADNTGHIDGDALEAAAFAWLASQHLAGLPGNVPSVTGARQHALLGCLTRPLQTR